MNDAEDLQERISSVREQLQDNYRVKGRDLAHSLRRARRFLPRRVRKAGQSLVDAQQKLGHPRLEPLLDFDAVRSAHRIVSDHLSQVDVAGQRRNRMLGMIGLLAFNVLFVAVCFVVWMVWAGYL